MNDIIDVINNKSSYIAQGMETFTVDDITYKGYGTYTFMWEKSYINSPTRSGNGAMGNLDTYSTFDTPHLTVKYSIMTIDDYRAMMKQLLEKNEFIVTCYDPIYDKMTTNRMYFATPSTPNYYCIASTDSEGKEVVQLLGVQDYTVELIGTNRPV